MRRCRKQETGKTEETGGGAAGKRRRRGVRRRSCREKEQKEELQARGDKEGRRSCWVRATAS